MSPSDKEIDRYRVILAMAIAAAIILFHFLYVGR